MSLQEKEKILAQVEDTGKGQLLSQLQVPRSTYYRWRSQQRQGKLGRSTQNPRIPWNSLSSEEVAGVLTTAWITDHQDFSVSEATVYRILRKAGLVKPLR